jgi:competence protein ComEC
VTGLDLRLLVPAMTAWAVLAAAVGGGAAQLLAGGATAFLGAGVVARRSPQVALCLTAVALVLLAAAGHQAREHAGPVPELAGIRAVVTVTGTVATEPRTVRRGDERPDLVVLEMVLDEVRARGAVSSVRTPVVVFADDTWSHLSWRSTVTARGRLGTVDGDSVVAAFTPLSAPEVPGDAGPVFRAADVVRDRLRAAVDPLPEDARGLVPGLVIGDTSLTPPALHDAMLATGMSHLSAVSGSNVAVVVAAVVLVCGWLGVGRRWRPPAALLSIVLFVILCRPEPSVLRAGVMGGIGLLALSSARRRVSLPALAGAVLVLLCVDPWLSRSYGFALSTLATLGLVLFARPWGDSMASRLPRRLGLLGHAVAIPLAAQVACGPVIVLLQGNVSTVAVLANLLAAPLVAPTTIGGITAGLTAVVWVPLGTAVAWLTALPAQAIGLVARWCARVPMGTVDWPDGGAGAVLLAVLTVVVLLTGPWLRHQAGRRPGVALAMLALLVALVWPLPRGGWPPSRWVVVGCDVGQGDAFVIPTGERRAVLVDTGPEPDAVTGCLRELGIEQLDAVVLTHFHADHVGGLTGVLDSVDVATVLTSPVRDPQWQAVQVEETLRQHGLTATPLTTGQHLAWGEVRAEVLWPPPGTRDQVGANNASVVLAVTVEGVDLLMTGDIEPEAARGVRRQVGDRTFDVVKVPHHGSAAQDPDLLAGSGAVVALIGVGADNSFGHPTATALRLLAEAGAVVLRADRHGDVAVVLDGDGELGVVTERDG